MIRDVLQCFSDVKFHMIVEATLHQKVIPLDSQSEQDKALLDDLQLALDDFAELYYQRPITPAVFEERIGRKPKSFRNNEVGSFADTVLEEHFQRLISENKLKTVVSFNRLSANGYPDEQLVDRYDRVTYLEVKATSRRDQGSPRDFFFHPGRNTRQKVTKDARHLLVGFDTRETAARHFIITGWCLVDLHEIAVSMKPEFNTDNIGLYSTGHIILEHRLEE